MHYISWLNDQLGKVSRQLHTATKPFCSIATLSWYLCERNILYQAIGVLLFVAKLKVIPTIVPFDLDDTDSLTPIR